MKTGIRTTLVDAKNFGDVMIEASTTLNLKGKSLYAWVNNVIQPAKLKDGCLEKWLGLARGWSEIEPKLEASLGAGNAQNGTIKLALSMLPKEAPAPAPQGPVAAPGVPLARPGENILDEDEAVPDAGRTLPEIMGKKPADYDRFAEVFVNTGGLVSQTPIAALNTVDGLLKSVLSDPNPPSTNEKKQMKKLIDEIRGLIGKIRIKHRL
jgi:hypothetical protein